MLARARPYNNPNLAELYVQIMSGSRPDITKLPAGTPAAVVDMIQKCWSSDPSLRLSAQECYELLDFNHSVETNENFDIFFSHTWVSKSFLKNVYKSLVKYGYRVWYDEVEMKQNMTKSMEEGIERSKVVVVCLNKLYPTKPNCMFELDTAVALGKHIITIVLDENVMSWANDKVKDACGISTVGGSMYVDMSRLAKEDWENPMEVMYKDLSGQLELLTGLLRSSNCHPSFAISNMNKGENYVITRAGEEIPWTPQLFTCDKTYIRRVCMHEDDPDIIPHNHGVSEWICYNELDLVTRLCVAAACNLPIEAVKIVCDEIQSQRINNIPVTNALDSPTVLSTYHNGCMTPYNCFEIMDTSYHSFHELPRQENLFLFPDGNGFRAVHYAAMNGNVNCLQVLVENGANINIALPETYTSVTTYYRIGLFVMSSTKFTKFDVKFLQGSTPLHMAVIQKHADCVKYLKELVNIDRNVRDRFGFPEEYYAPNKLPSYKYCATCPGFTLLACHYLCCPLVPVCCTGCVDGLFFRCDINDNFLAIPCVCIDPRVSEVFGNGGGGICHYDCYLECKCCLECISYISSCCNFFESISNGSDCHISPDGSLKREYCCDIEYSCAIIRRCCIPFARTCSVPSCVTCLLPSYSGRYFYNGYISRDSKIMPPEWKVMECVSRYTYSHYCVMPISQLISVAGLIAVDSCICLTISVPCIVQAAIRTSVTLSVVPCLCCWYVLALCNKDSYDS